jgi:histidyl-tRNA synthetase
VNARAAVILGEEEVARHAASLRDLDTGQQEEVSLDELGRHLARFA